MTSTSSAVVVAPNGRVFRLGSAALACAQDLLAGDPPEVVAARHRVDAGSVGRIQETLRKAEVTSLAPVEARDESSRVQVRGVSAVQLTLWRPGERFAANAASWRRLTGPAARAVAAAVGVLGVAVALANGVTVPRSVSLWQACAALLATLFLTSLHELGHVVALGAHGVRPRRVGLMLFYGSVAMFSDVSPAWSLPGRRDRLEVIAWGGLVTGLEAGLVGLLAANTADPVVGLVFYGLLGALLLNLVPLARFDGYYLLILWRTSPRLRDDALHAVRSRLARHVHAGAGPTPVGRVLFGLASVLYGCLLWSTAVVQTATSLRLDHTVSISLAPPPALPVYLGTVALFAGFALHALVRPRPENTVTSSGTSGAAASPAVPSVLHRSARWERIVLASATGLLLVAACAACAAAILD